VLVLTITIHENEPMQNFWTEFTDVFRVIRCFNISYYSVIL
jgi:hypothetical protein